MKKIKQISNTKMDIIFDRHYIVYTYQTTYGLPNLITNN